MEAVAVTGKRRREFRLLEGLQAMASKRRRLERHNPEQQPDAALLVLWDILVTGPAHGSFMPCLISLELARFEATQRAMREMLLESTGWEACARRELPAGPLVSTLHLQRGTRHLKAMVAACRSGVLRPSLEDTGVAAAMLRVSSGLAYLQCRRRVHGDLSPQVGCSKVLGSLFPVDWTSRFRCAVTSLCFGQERRRRTYILLVVAFADGNAFVLRCHRTPLERTMLASEEVDQNGSTLFRTILGNLSFSTFHSAICGHRKAITSMFFSRSEDTLATSSLDSRVCVWDIASGCSYSPPVAIFEDSAPLLVAVPMPLCEEAFVAANSVSVLRAVNLRGGASTQRFKLNAPVQAVRFDSSGRNLLAGTKLGSLQVLRALESGKLEYRFGNSQLSNRGGVTCIAFSPARGGRPALFLVGIGEASVAIMECCYGSGRQHGILVGLRSRCVVPIMGTSSSSPAPRLLSCCYSPAGQGHLICGSSDGGVRACPLGTDGCPVEHLRDHNAPVSAMAVNSQGTMLASADHCGRVVLWRQMVHFPA